MRALLVAALLASAVPAMAEQDAVAAARELLAKGSAERAVEMLRPVVADEPDNADARILLGTALALEGVRAESIAQLHEAIQLRPESAAAYNSLGMALSRFLETSAAREAFEKAIRLDPNLASAHVNLSTILAQSGESALATQHLDRAIQIESDTPLAARAYYLRAEIHRERNELEASRADLEQAVRLRPDFATAWSELGVVRRVLAEETGALQAFEQAVRFAPQDGTAQLRLGSEYLRNGKPHEAVEHLRRALRIGPDSRAVLYNLQRALREDGQIEDAKTVEARMQQLLLQRSRVSATSLEVAKLNNQGVELEKTGNVLAALGKYQAALELDPEHGGFRLNLGLALCRLGRWDEGIANMREVVRRDPNNAQAVKALYIALERQPKTAGPDGKPVSEPPR